jgi:hypothetical protein
MTPTHPKEILQEDDVIFAVDRRYRRPRNNSNACGTYLYEFKFLNIIRY